MRGAFPGGVVMASRDGRPVVAESAGKLSSDQGAAPVELDAVYDLASVSKVFTSVAALTLVERGELALDDAVGRFLPGLPEETAVLSVRELLAHVGGLTGGQELHRLHPTSGALREAIMAVRPGAGVRGNTVIYSSLGYLLLGWVIEAASDTPLDSYLEQAVLGPCGLTWTCFRPPAAWLGRIAPTEIPVHGQVHDEKARILGGVVGHAGLFAPAADVLRFGEALLDPDHPVLGPSRSLLFEDLTGGLVPRRSVAFVIEDPVFAVWDAPCFTHTGFTGTSLCLVPASGVVTVMLTNRINPTRVNDRIAAARTRVHRALHHQLTGDT